MKRIVLLILLIQTQAYTFSQPWNSDFTKTKANFFEIQTAFNNYWNGLTPGKGEGYTQFKRWEWFWEQRVGLSGEFPPSDINYTEWQNFISKQKLYKSIPFKTNWQFLGPTITPSGYNGLGRLSCVAFHPTDTNTLWVGSPSGGIWKTTDLGKNWTPLSDYNLVLGVSSIAVNPNFPDSIYIATGDGDRGSLWGMTGSTQGDNKSIGILLTSDGGKTWNKTGLNWNIFDSKLISKLLMNPQNSQHLICATSDGIYVTNNGGVSWSRKQIGYFMDIAFAPGNPKIVYATTFENGNAKMYKSRDGGNSFKQTFIKPLAARITIGVTPANPNKVHLLISDKKDGKFGGIHHSLDTGNTFKVKYDTGKINLLSSAYDGKTKRGQGWYDLAYIISPYNENLILVGGVNNWKSTNGADSFKINTMWTGSKSQNPKAVQVTHADKHFFAYNPLSGYLFDCNDGGIYYSKNNGDSWTDISQGLGITQFYRFSITETDTNIVLGGTQDNGARVRRGNNWYEASGGDGMECGIDPIEPNIMYTSYANGRLYRHDENGQTTISDKIKDKPKGSWVTPFVIDPNNNKTIYAGFKMIYKTSDRGETWTKICDSIWRPNYVIHIAVAPTNSNVIYASDYYKVYKTTDAGSKWTLIHTSTVPISCLKVHPFNPDLFYYTNSSYTNTAKVYRINSLATLNEKIANLTYNLPNVAINCIEYDKSSKEGLFIGTDIGVFYKDTSMLTWELINSNLPNVVVTDLDINYKERLLYAATYGRGIWKSPIDINRKLNSPFIVSLEPNDNSSKVQPSSQLIIYFNEPIRKGNGIISIFENSNETQKINVNSDSVTIEGNRAVISPSAFGLAKLVNIKYPEGTFIDLDSNTHRGIVNNTDWNFNTVIDLSYKKTERNGEVVTLFPNPGNKELEIMVNDFRLLKSITFYNNLGSPVLLLNKFDSNKCLINIENFSSGLYNIEFNINDSLTYKRLIIK